MQPMLTVARYASSTLSSPCALAALLAALSPVSRAFLCSRSEFRQPSQLGHPEVLFRRSRVAAADMRFVPC